VLIADGRVVARASVENEGRVAFDAAMEGIQRFAVRLDPVEDTSAAGTGPQARLVLIG